MANFQYNWTKTGSVGRKKFVCGHCDSLVAPDQGYYTDGGHIGRIWICPHCTAPTFFSHIGTQHPSVRLGRDVNGITDPHVLSAYQEARGCTAAGAHTAAVLLCRKLIMNIAVHQGAAAGGSFASYVDYLESKGFVPPHGKPWVDEIRKIGNIATHDIPATTSEESKRILNFVEMLLRFIYEFPSMVGQPA